MSPPDETKPAAEPSVPGSKHGDETTSPGTTFPVVGIGASAGGLAALEALLRRLARDGMGYVVVQHLAPGHESLLPEILSRATALPVVAIRDGQPIERDTIHITPPNAAVTIQNGFLRLATQERQLPPHSIDAFFMSLAGDKGPLAIGVVLSGAGSDGTVGLRAIKEQGGITFAQEPSTASQPSMPESAIDAGCADFCLAPEEIGDELMRLSAHPYVARGTPSRLFTQDTLSRLFDLLRRDFGVDFSSYKLNTIVRRIERRMALQKVERAGDYLRLVEASPTELRVLYSDLLIGVTAFFRDVEPFVALKSIVFPHLVEGRRSDVPLRIWVPGCATGEEAYSIAFSLLEYLEGVPVPLRFPIQIFATDIDERALALARAAVYPPSIESEVSPERLKRFFTRLEKGFQVHRRIRDLMVFSRHVLGKDPPFSHLDLVSCRNVLIYLQPPLQRKVLRVFHYALNPDAYLLLGTSESVGEAAELFSQADRAHKIYVKKDGASAGVFDLGGTPGLRREGVRPILPLAPGGERRPSVSIQHLADRKVLDRYGPPGMLLDENLEVLQFRGELGRYLSPKPGAATLNALKLVRPELLMALRSALQEANATSLVVTSEPVQLPGERAAVAIDVLPVQETGSRSRFFLVGFREAPSALASRPSVEGEPGGEPAPERRADALERELLLTKESLQTSIQELESANEQLQSFNEELQSSNEELQSTNEELETSKEELQSTNEELSTVNEELHTRMAQLSVASDDLSNVLGHVSEPVVLVGMDLRIRRFSAAAQTLLSLLQGDVGRPISYLGSALSMPELESTVSEAISTARSRERRVRCSDGRWYSMRTAPSRGADHAMRGAILEFVRAPPVRLADEPLEIHEFVGKVLSTLPHVLMLLDEHLRVVWANRAFFDTFLHGAESLGQSLDDIWPGRSSHPALWSQLEEAVARGTPFGEVLVEHPFGRQSARPMRFSARALPGEGDRPALTLVVMEETREEGPPS